MTSSKWDQIPKFVVFHTSFNNKGRDVCCKVSLYKNCQWQSCSAIKCFLSGINILAGGSSVPLISKRKGTDPHWKHLRCTHFASSRGSRDVIASLAWVQLTGWPVAWNWRRAVLSADAGLLVTSRCTSHRKTHKTLERTQSNDPPPQPFYGPFTGTSRLLSQCQKELLDFMVQQKINKGRQTDHPAGHHSIPTNQCLPPPSPIFLQAVCPSCCPTNSSKALKATKQWSKPENIPNWPILHDPPTDWLMWESTSLKHIFSTSNPTVLKNSKKISKYSIPLTIKVCTIVTLMPLLCIDAVGWVAGKASGL